MRLLLMAIFLISSLLHDAHADEYSKYFSFKYGTVKANSSSVTNHQFKEDKGSTKDIEFFWGSKYWVQLLGGVQLSPKNKVDGYLVSFVFQSKNIFAVRNYVTNDELYKWDIVGGKQGSFGNIKAKTTEYSYMWRTRSDAYSHITYGTSTYPLNIHTKKSGEDAYFSDPRPKVQYLYWGLDADPIRMALLDNVEIKDQPSAGEFYYLGMRLGFGVIKTQLSDTQYSNTYKNSSNQYGLNNQKATDLYMPIYAEGGFHTSGQTSLGRAVGSIGGYMQLPSLVSNFITDNDSTTGYKWSATQITIYGLLARLAIVF